MEELQQEKIENTQEPVIEEKAEETQEETQEIVGAVNPVQPRIVRLKPVSVGRTLSAKEKRQRRIRNKMAKKSRRRNRQRGR
jgi:hypothetical protein